MVDRGPCAFCGRQVTTIEQAARPITGWEAERESGGANAIIGRTRATGMIAHAVCVRFDKDRGAQLAMDA